MTLIIHQICHFVVNFLLILSMQWKIINEVLNYKQDICVVMATGKVWIKLYFLKILFALHNTIFTTFNTAYTIYNKYNTYNTDNTYNIYNYTIFLLII